MHLFSWEKVKKDSINDKVWRKFVSGEKATVAQFFFAKGGVVPTHQHENEQITYVLEGALKFVVGNEEVVVRRGEVLHIPSNVPHGATALEDTLDLEIFSPIRSDWLAGNDPYKEKR